MYYIQCAQIAAFARLTNFDHFVIRWRLIKSGRYSAYYFGTDFSGEYKHHAQNNVLLLFCNRTGQCDYGEVVRLLCKQLLQITFLNRSGNMLPTR